MNIRKTVITILLFLAAAAGSYSGYWYYARQTASQLIDNWATQRRAEGYKIAFDTPKMGGYPLLIRAVLNAPRLQRGDFAWRGERIDIEFQPWNFRRIRIDFTGKQWMSLAGGARQMLLDPAEAAIVARFS